MKTVAWTPMIWAWTSAGPPVPTYMNGLTKEVCETNRSKVLAEHDRSLKEMDGVLDFGRRMRRSAVCLENRQHTH